MGVALRHVPRFNGGMPRASSRWKIMDRDHLIEGLKHIPTLVKAACESDDIEVVRKHLKMVRLIYDKASAPDAIKLDR
jgi:hypothetical protein